MLSVLAVFISAFFMQGAAHNLFVPLALAVGFAMVASYLLSSTLVPVLAIWILGTHPRPDAAGPLRFDRIRDRYRDFLPRVVRRRSIVVPTYLAVAGLIIIIIGGALGRAIFPTVDAGQLTLRMRAPAGTRIEETEKLANKTLDIIRREVGPQNVAMTLGFVGVQNAQYPINTIYLWTSGPEEAVLQVQLNPKAGIGVADLEEKLRKTLSQELPGVRYSFEPSDIVSRAMSFGTPTPIEVVVSGPDFTKTRPFAQNLQVALAKVSSLRDLGFEQELDYPAVKVDIDRELAGMLGVTADHRQIPDGGDIFEPIQRPAWATKCRWRCLLSAWIHWSRSKISQLAGVRMSKSIFATSPM
jgi:multidrug efflux pump subunit AcrB